MAEGNSPINLSELSKPATVLVKKVCNAVGILYEPTRIRRQAKAEVDAEKIRALASIELNELQERALERLLHQEARKQDNIEAITAQAAAALGPEAQAEKLDEDWIAHFFKQCDTVSDKEMQSLWSRLLSGEATRPGTYSKRTVDFVAAMDKRDAQLFTSFCQFCWLIGNLTPLIFDVQHDVFKKKGITFPVLKHLDAIGLVSFESLSGYLKPELGKRILVYYFGTPTLIEFQNNDNNQLSLGHALLTQAGQELAPICGAKRDDEFYEHVISHWHKQGFVLSTVLPTAFHD